MRAGLPLSYELHSALRYLRANLGRTSLLVLAVAVGTAALVIALSLMTGMEQDIRERVFGSSAHLTILSRLDREFHDADGLIQRVEAQPGVTAANFGPRTPDQLREDLGALAVELTDAELAAIDEIVPPGSQVLSRVPAPGGIVIADPIPPSGMTSTPR